MKNETRTGICVVCGKEFKPRSKKNICCSPECLKVRTAERERLERYPNGEPSRGKFGRSLTPVKCKRCGKEFMQNNVAQKYCSKECLHEATLENARYSYHRNKGNPQPRRTGTPNKGLNKVARAAAKAKLSYGYYKAMQYDLPKVDTNINHQPEPVREDTANE